MTYHLPARCKGKLAAFQVGDEDIPAVPANSKPNFMSKALNKCANQYHQNLLIKGGLRSLHHLLRCNNILERLISRTKLIMNDTQSSMDSSTLGTIIILRMTKDLWIEREMEIILN